MARALRAGLLGAVLVAAGAGLPLAGTAVAVPAPAADDGGMIIVLDSSGSMAGPDGSGHPRIAAARTAVGSAVDSLPDGYPTGLRVYGAGAAHGCDDTTLAQPVAPLDRAAVKRAVAAVRPKGDGTPTAHALTEAAADLPAGGHRTILLVSDGGPDCGHPTPCKTAARLAGDGLRLRIDAVGFQVTGAARDELECVARAGHGAYYDAPDAAALGRQLVRAAQLSAGAYRLAGRPVIGGAAAAKAATLAPGQYLASIGPGETRWYAAGLDAAATDDLAVTAVPQPGVPVDYGDGIEVRLSAAGRDGFTCDTQSAHFGQDEGAMPLTAAVSRIPGHDHDGGCDKAGRYVLSVHRTSATSSDQGRWPLELRFTAEAPLPAGTVPAAARTDYGAAPPPVTGTPEDVTGGTGFNDPARIGTGVWRDRLLPAQTRFYAVHVGWGQQLTYAADFSGEPVVDGGASAGSTFVTTSAYAPDRLPVEDASDARGDRSYSGSPVSVGLGTVPVTWTNRWVSGAAAHDVHRAGDYVIAVGLGPRAAGMARDTAVGVLLRVRVTGRELAGPQYQAPPAAGTSPDGHTDRPAGPGPGSGGSGGAGDSRESAGAAGSAGFGGLRAVDLAAAGTGGAVALAGLGVAALVHRARVRVPARAAAGSRARARHGRGRGRFATVATASATTAPAPARAPAPPASPAAAGEGGPGDASGGGPRPGGPGGSSGLGGPGGPVGEGGFAAGPGGDGGPGVDGRSGTDAAPGWPGGPGPDGGPGRPDAPDTGDRPGRGGTPGTDGGGA